MRKNVYFLVLLRHGAGVMDVVLDTLFLPLNEGVLVLPEGEGGSAAFLNARVHPALGALDSLYVQQGFKPYAAELGVAGFEIAALADIPAGQQVVFVNIPKNAVEARFLIARGLEMLCEGGVLVAAADNKAGGARLEKWLTAFGVSDVRSLSKNKARVVWGVKDALDQGVVDEAIASGSVQAVEKIGFVSQAGIYGWDKVDKGSEILVQHLPLDLKGRGADFGCGYGYLARYVLQNCAGVDHLICLDADRRALDCCSINCDDERVECQWEDLAKPLKGLKDPPSPEASARQGLDFIVMNPPFHEGKKTDVGVGKAFVENACDSLRSGGILYMVANVHLPYEGVLEGLFSRVEKLTEENGFKVFAAIK